MTASDNGDGLVDSALEVAMGGDFLPQHFMVKLTHTQLGKL